MKICFVSALFFVLLIPQNNAKLVKHIFVVNYVEGSPDGVHKDKILGINGKFPGPTIEADIFDTIQVDLVNLIQDGQNVSLHWHGIHQNGTPFEDGASQMNQCPLKNRYVQRYQFDVHQSGTYWYHSHVNSQYTEGLWGVLIVHNKPEVYSYDGEIVIAVNDWYHRTAIENEHWHLSPTSRGVPPYLDSVMMNGKGRYSCNFAALQDRKCNATLQSRPLFNVHRNKTYRVRVINTSAVISFNFSIDGHILETVEVDGIDTVPVTADYAMVGAAQRYSFLIRSIPNNPFDRYLIRAEVLVENLLFIEKANINQYPEALMGDVTGVLQYIDTTTFGEHDEFEQFSWLEKVPPKELSHLRLLDEMLLSPYDGSSAPPHFDKEMILEIGFYEDHEDIRRGSFNHTPFKLPDHKPLLMQLIDGDDLSPNAYSLEIDHFEVVQVIVNNPFYGPHPFHLHGAHFWVLGMGLKNDGNFDVERDNKTLSPIGIKRDTFMIQERSWGVIRFLADNPGVWSFHCHLEWHNLSGMIVTFIIGKDKIKQMTVTEEARRICAHHEMRKSRDDEPSDEISRANYKSMPINVISTLFCIILMNMS